MDMKETPVWIRDYAQGRIDQPTMVSYLLRAADISRVMQEALVLLVNSEACDSSLLTDAQEQLRSAIADNTYLQDEVTLAQSDVRELTAQVDDLYGIVTALEAQLRAVTQPTSIPAC